jgi:DNA-binding MarR family transcriptional regulator
MKKKLEKKARPRSTGTAKDRLGQAKKMRGYLPHYLSRLMNAMNLRLMVELRVHRMTISQFRIIQMLDARGSASIGEIAADTVIEQSVVSRIVDQLERAQLAQRRKRTGDGRNVDVSLTPKGRKLYNDLFPRAALIVDDAMSELSQSERDLLETLMFRLFHGTTQRFKSWDTFVRKGRP